MEGESALTFSECDGTNYRAVADICWESLARQGRIAREVRMSIVGKYWNEFDSSRRRGLLLLGDRPDCPGTGRRLQSESSVSFITPPRTRSSYTVISLWPVLSPFTSNESTVQRVSGNDAKLS